MLRFPEVLILSGGTLLLGACSDEIPPEPDSDLTPDSVVLRDFKVDSSGEAVVTGLFGCGPDDVEAARLGQTIELQASVWPNPEPEDYLCEKAYRLEQVPEGRYRLIIRYTYLPYSDGGGRERR